MGRSSKHAHQHKQVHETIRKTKCLQAYHTMQNTRIYDKEQQNGSPTHEYHTIQHIPTII